VNQSERISDRAVSIDRTIEEAVTIGQANKRTMELVQNWCAHARVEPRGGIGMVEQSTGLPIGMRAMTCPYAKAAGFAAMDLAAVALDFYDRNCVGCTDRRPVRMPNLSELVAERDKEREQHEAAVERFRLDQASKLVERRQKQKIGKSPQTSHDWEFTKL
jgi:hypothetical protein